MPDTSNLVVNLDPNSPTLADDVWEVVRATIPDSPGNAEWIDASRQLLAAVLMRVIRPSSSDAVPFPSGPDLSVR